VKASHEFDGDSAVFDDGNLVPSAGLVQVMTLAEQTGLRRPLGEKVHIGTPRNRSGSARTASMTSTWSAVAG
jgi:hypothetical protein